MTEPELPGEADVEVAGPPPKLLSPVELSELLQAGEAAFQAGHLDEAEQLAVQAMTGAPKDSRAKVLRANVAFRSNRADVGIHLLREALQDNPDSISALRGLALRLHAIGRPLQAIPHCKRVVELRPDDIGARDFLGVLYLAVGKPAEAASCFLKAIELAPGHAQFHLNLGTALGSLGRVPEARAAFERANELDPNSAAPLVALGHLMRRAGDSEASAVYFKRAHELEPESMRGLKSLAKSMVDQGDFSGAAQTLERAVELDPNEGDSRLRLGSILMRLGRFQESKAQFLKAIELQPNESSPYAAAATGSRMSEADRPMIERMIQLARSAGLSLRDRRNLNFALGKAFEDIGDYKEAIKYFDEGNGISLNIRNREPRIDLQARESAIEREIQTFTRQAFEENAAIGSDSERPIVLVGMLRSGMALLEQILTSHPDVGAGDEPEFWPEHQKDVYSGPRRSVSPGRVASLGREFERLLAENSPDKLRASHRSPENYLCLGQIHMALPKAKLVHCRRHPVDTCLSIYTTLGEWPIDMAHSRANIVRAYQDYARLMDHWGQALPEGSMFEVDYESLVAEPEPTLRGLLEFLCLKWDEACLHPERNERWFRTPSYAKLREPIFTRSAARWKNYEAWLGEFASLIPQEAAR